MLIALGSVAGAQVVERWTLTIAPSPYLDAVYASVTDATGAITIAGSSQTSSGEFSAYPSAAAFVARVDVQGVLQWHRTHAPQSDWRTVFVDLATGPAGSVYAVGYTASTGSPGSGDLVLARYASDGTPLWAIRYDTGEFESGVSVATDPNGDAWVTGQVTVGSLAITDLLLLRVSPAGGIVFARSWNGAANGNDSGAAVLPDGQGGAYVTGEANDVALNADVVVLRFDAAGNVQWSRTLSGGEAAGIDLDLDAAGKLYVTGRLAPPGFVTRPFLAKYDANGTLEWQRIASDPEHGGGYGQRVAVDPHGDVVIAGAWGFEPTHTDVLVRKYSPAGNVVWTRNWAGPGARDDARALAIDAAGEIAIAGASAPLGQTAVTDVLVLRLDRDGRVLWSRTLGPPTQPDFGQCVGFGPIGSVLFAGMAVTAGQHVLVGRLDDSAVPFCFGDGSGSACPCGNSTLARDRAGCASSLGQGGSLRASGASSLTVDTLVLEGRGMPNSSALYFQGTNAVGAGAGSVFGDGLRCAGGVTIRLRSTVNAAGASQYPLAGDPSVSQRGQVMAPGTRTYQVWYRNAAAFCTSETFNLTNGVLVEWTP